MISGINNRLSQGKSALTSRFLFFDKRVCNTFLSYNRTYNIFEKGEYPLNFTVEGVNDISDNTIDGFSILDHHNLGMIMKLKNIDTGLFDELDDRIFCKDSLDGTLNIPVESLSLDLTHDSFSNIFLALSSELSSYIGDIDPFKGSFNSKLDFIEYHIIFSSSLKVSMSYVNNNLRITILNDNKKYIIKEESLIEILTSMSGGILPSEIRSISDTKPNIEKILCFREDRLSKMALSKQKKESLDALKSKSYDRKIIKNFFTVH